jgi:hypothetical protein
MFTFYLELVNKSNSKPNVHFKQVRQYKTSAFLIIMEQLNLLQLFSTIQKFYGYLFRVENLNIQNNFDPCIKIL